MKKALIVSALVSAFGIILLVVLSETMPGIHSRSYWQRVAAACDEVLAESPEPRKIPRGDPGLPPAIQQLHPRSIEVTKIGVIFKIRTHLMGYWLAWHSVDDARTHWDLVAGTEGRDKVLFSTNKPTARTTRKEP